MNDYTVSVQVIKAYDLHVEAESEEQAIELVEAMQTTSVEEEGKCTNVELEYAQVVDENDI